MIEVRLLGPLEVAVDGVPARLPGRRERTIVAALAVVPGVRLTADRLTDILWPDEPPGDPGHAIETYVSRIRRALGRGAVSSGPLGYAMAVDVETDVARFEERVQAAREASRDGLAAVALAAYEAALGMWRGGVLQDLGEAPFLAAPRAKLEEARRVALEELLALRVASGDHAAAIPMLAELVEAEPLREAARAVLMLALYRAGRQAEALATYHAYRERIDDELGLDPSPALDARYRAILVQDPALLPPGSSSNAGGRRLPAIGTSFVGRDRELGRMRALIARSRLVTLVGPGGSGKTRLAIESAVALAGARADGAWFIPLEGIVDGADVAAVAASSLDVHVAEGRSVADSVVDRLRGSDALLVFDNCEHVIDAAADLIRAILAGTSGTAIIATSRERLRLAAEAVASVPPLDLPPPDADPQAALSFDGPRLFLERASGLDGSLADRPEDVRSIIEICTRVDGLPLGIELLAGLTRALSVREIAARVGAALDVEAAIARDLPARQRTLRATARWSFSLLDPSARVILARLAVFAGSFDIEAAEVVAAGGASRSDALVALPELVDRSLVLRGDADGQTRFRLLSTVRTAARAELLDDTELAHTRAAHARWVDARAASGDGTASDWAMADWIRDIERIGDDVRAALAWAAEPGGDPHVGLRTAVSMGRVWEWRGQADEGRVTLERILPLVAAAPADTRSGAWMWLGYFDWRLGRIDEGHVAVDRALEAAEAAGDESATAGALGIRSLLLRADGRTVEAEQAALDARAIWERRGDPWAIAYTDLLAARAALAGDRVADAAAALSRAESRYAELDYGRGQAWTLMTDALIRRRAGRDSDARALARRAIETARELGDADTEAEGLETLASIAREAGDAAEADALAEAAARLRVTPPR